MLRPRYYVYMYVRVAGISKAFWVLADDTPYSSHCGHGIYSYSTSLYKLLDPDRMLCFLY